MGNGHTDTAGLHCDRQLIETLRRVAATADAVPADAGPIARALLAWRTVDADLAFLLGGPESSGQPPPAAVPAGACHASPSAH